MLKRLVLALFLVLGAAGIAEAETCLAGGSFRTTGVTDQAGWTGCTASADDTFRLDTADDYVVIDGDFGISTGRVHCQNGTLVLNQPWSLTHPGSTLDIEEPCIFVAQGEKVLEARIRSVPTYPASNLVQITSDSDITGIDVVRDYIVFLGDDPPGETDPVTQLHLPVGPSRQGWSAFRPEKGRWYKIDAVNTGNRTIDYHIDECLSINSRAVCYPDAAPGEPYEGTYLNLARTPSTVNAKTPIDFGTATELQFASTTLLRAINDGTDQYVIFPQATATPREWDDCSEWRVKILSSRPDAGGDLVTVAGDVSHCTPTTVRITRGAGRGDPFMIVRPAKIGGGLTGGIEWQGGQIRWEYVMLDGLVSQDNSGHSPATGQEAAFNIFAEDASNAPNGSGSYVRWLHMYRAGRRAGGAVPWSWINISSHSTSGTTPRFGTTMSLDLQGMPWEWVYAHSQYNASGSNGGHVFFDQQSTNKTLSNFRFERYDDDGYWGVFGLTDPPQQSSLNGYISMAQVPDDTRSGEPIVLESLGYGIDLANTFVVNKGYFEIVDPFMVGVADGGFNIHGPGLNVLRPVLAGDRGWSVCNDAVDRYFAADITSSTNLGGNPQWGGCYAAGLPTACCAGLATGTCEAVDNLPVDYSSGIEDAIIWHRPPCGGTTNFYEGVRANHIVSSILLLGRGSIESPNYRIRNASRIYESFVNVGDSGTGEGFLDQDQEVDLVKVCTTAPCGDESFQKPKNLDIRDSILVSDTLGINHFSNGYVTVGQVQNLESADLSRLSFLLVGMTAAGPFDLDLEDMPTNSVTLDHFKSTTTNGAVSMPSGANGVETNFGAQVTDSCLKTTQDPATAWGANVGAGNRTTNLLIPTPNMQSPPGGFAKPGYGETACGEPRRIGLRTLGRNQMLLGTAFLHQLDRFSSDLRVSPHRSASEDVHGAGRKPRALP